MQDSVKEVQTGGKMNGMPHYWLGIEVAQRTREARSLTVCVGKGIRRLGK